MGDLHTGLDTSNFRSPTATPRAPSPPAHPPPAHPSSRSPLLLHPARLPFLGHARGGSPSAGALRLPPLPCLWRGGDAFLRILGMAATALLQRGVPPGGTCGSPSALTGHTPSLLRVGAPFLTRPCRSAPTPSRRHRVGADPCMDCARTRWRSGFPLRRCHLTWFVDRGLAQAGSSSQRTMVGRGMSSCRAIAALLLPAANSSRARARASVLAWRRACALRRPSAACRSRKGKYVLCKPMQAEESPRKAGSRWCVAGLPLCSALLPRRRVSPFRMLGECALSGLSLKLVGQ